MSLPSNGGPTRTAVIVMSPHDWADMTSASWGGFDDALEKLQTALLTLKPHQTYLVWSNHRLIPSATAELEPDPGPALGSPRDIRNRVNRTLFLCAYMGLLWVVSFLTGVPVSGSVLAVWICCLVGGAAVGLLRPWIVPSRHGGKELSFWVLLGSAGRGAGLLRSLPDEAVAFLLGGFFAGFIGLGVVSSLRLGRR